MGGMVLDEFSLMARSRFETNRQWSNEMATVFDYADFLASLKQVADIVPLAEIAREPNDRIRVGLRYDVDACFLSAMYMARIEKDLDVPATYYFLPTATYYGHWSSAGVHRNDGIFKLMLYMQDDLGREIGYHDDWTKLLVDHGLPPEEILRAELDFWRTRGVRVKTIVAHNSAYVYGVGNYELWKGQAIDGRMSAKLADREVKLNHLNRADFGLDYDGNFVRRVTWLGKPLVAHGQQRDNAEQIERNVDFAIGISKHGLCGIYSAQDMSPLRENIPLAALPREIQSFGTGKRWLVLGHPDYFAKAPQLPGLVDHMSSWVSETESRGTGLLRPVVNLTSSWNGAFQLCRALGGQSLTRTPEMLRNRIRYYSRKNHEGAYWENARPGIHLMATYVEKTFNLIRSRFPDLSQVSLLDIAGGCGNLGLALKMFSLREYVLNDMHKARLVWSTQLFKDYGFDLITDDTDMRILDAKKKHDAVSILGWENFDVTFEQAIQTAARCLKPGGLLVITNQDYDLYRIGNWQRVYEDAHKKTPPYRDGLYVISLNRMAGLLKDNGFRIVDWDTSGHLLSANGAHPQHVMAAELEARD
jgi:SAM-dependent methyltransferase